MNIWETMTGSDMTRDWKAFQARIEALPADYQAAWTEIAATIFPAGNFTGRNLMPIFDSVLELLEETAADGLSVSYVLGEDIAGFCAALTDGEGARDHRDRWRDQLNRNVARKLGRLGG